MQLTNFTLPAGLGWMMSIAQSRPNITVPSETWAYTLPRLPYSYDALEPYFDEETMRIHHTKHHQTYVNNLNAALQGTELHGLHVDELMIRFDDVPTDKRTAVRNHGGGHANHSFFRKNLKVGTTLTGDLKDAIDRAFGSFEAFQQQFEKASATVFGSGWAWLVLDSAGGLEVVTTANQDSPLMGRSVAGAAGFPIIGLDVWEHAYYLKYRNVRPEYIKAYWHVVNWEFASERYAQGQSYHNDAARGMGFRETL